MAVIVWKEVYQTGIVALDNEHKQLIAQINRLYEAIRDKRGAGALGETIRMLLEYTEQHFQHEEQLLAQFHFPGREDHLEAHRSLRQQVEELEMRCAAGSEELARELFNFLRAWLLEHILEVDKKYGVYLESRGGRFLS